MPTLPLPAEVLSNVMAQLDPRADKGTLLACMLASKALSDVAMPVLYSNVTLTSKQFHALVTTATERVRKRPARGRKKNWYYLKLTSSGERRIGYIKALTLSFAISDVELLPAVWEVTHPGVPLFPNVRELILVGDPVLDIWKHRLSSKPPPMPEDVVLFDKPDICVQDVYDLLPLLPAKAYGNVTVHSAGVYEHALPPKRWDAARLFPFTSWDVRAKTPWWVEDEYPPVTYVVQPSRTEADEHNMNGRPEPVPEGIKIVNTENPVPCGLCGQTWVDYAEEIKHIQECQREHMAWVKEMDTKDAEEAAAKGKQTE